MLAHISTFIFANLTIKKLKRIDIINVLSDLVSEKLETTVKLPIKLSGQMPKNSLILKSERFFYFSLIIFQIDILYINFS